MPCRHSVLTAGMYVVCAEQTRTCGGPHIPYVGLVRLWTCGQLVVAQLNRLWNIYTVVFTNCSLESYLCQLSICRLE
jgi:hypothetical protein